MELELQLLGSFAAFYGGTSLDRFRSSKTQALLAYLTTEAAFGPNDTTPVHQREQLMTLLWPHKSQKSAQVNLRQVLYQLRQSIPQVPDPAGRATPFIVSDRQKVQISPSAHYDFDVARFLDIVAGEPAPDRAARAATLYRGPFLSDFYLAESEPFEQWAASRRAALQRMALELLEGLTAYQLEHGAPAEAEAYARRQLALDNLRERGHQQLMHALAQQQQRSKALAHYRDYAALLQEKLGVPPSAEIEALYTDLRARKVAAPAVPRPVVEGRGERRLLPVPASPFIGRHGELAEINRRLKEGCRLLTLVGLGGSGKSRLAIEAARDLACDYRDGALFVELAPLSDPADIPTAIAATLNLRLTADRTPRSQVINYLANKELLLVLDNFEHLLEGAELVIELLQAAPALHLIVTSRALLNVAAESLLEVCGLALPEREDNLHSAEAVQMFLTYARRRQPQFDITAAAIDDVVRICTLVDGMPLALELAASWVRYLAPVEIARELDADLSFLESTRADLPERQRSMRAAFDHSWRLLERPQRSALMKLSVFRGGASRKAAGTVTGAPLRTLTVLADHSLLSFEAESGRITFHELIRQFAMERLEEAGEADVLREAHSAYYLTALIERLPELKGDAQLRALDAIEGDLENVRAAWRWATKHGRWQSMIEASQVLFLFALFRDRYSDGIELFQSARDALTPPGGELERRVRAYALGGEHALAAQAGLWKEARAALPALEAAIESLDCPADVAYCHLMLGHIVVQGTMSGERPQEAIRLMRAACTTYEKEKDGFYLAMALWRLGFAYARAEEPEKAIELYQRGLALVRERGDRFISAILLRSLGTETWTIEGPSKRAEDYFRRAAELERELGGGVRYAHTITYLAGIAGWRDAQRERTEALLEEALAIATEYAIPPLRAYILCGTTEVLLREGEYEAALRSTEEVLNSAGSASKHTEAWASVQRGIALLGLGQTAEAAACVQRWLMYVVQQSRPVMLPVYLPFVGVLLFRHGRHERAGELLALGLSDETYGRTLAADPLLTRLQNDLEESLTAEAFARAWECGKVLDPLEEAAEALEALSAG